MKYYNNGFYDTFKEGRVEITEERYSELLFGANQRGLTIKADEDGTPQLYTREGVLFVGDVTTYTPALTLDDVKRKKFAEVKAYDTSAEVNTFYYQGLPMWLSRDDRMSVNYSTNAEKAAGAETSTLFYNHSSIELPCDAIIDMLAKVEIYAKNCYKATELHIIAIDTLQTIEEVEAYDFKTNYPKKLNF